MTDLVTEFDAIPSFWQFLNGLDCNDLVAELVQNDLDQDATQTVSYFEKNQLICEGNGRPVDRDGWKRLRSIQGAGDQVPAKRGKIGVKNHGLKTAFTIGDEIHLSNLETSRAFFEWLSTRDLPVQRQHIPYVFRHILNEKGAMNWVDVFPDIPFIPVENRDGVFLVSLSQVYRGLVCLPDVDDEIVSEIRERDTGIKIVINTIEEIKRPISEPLNGLAACRTWVPGLFLQAMIHTLLSWEGALANEYTV